MTAPGAGEGVSWIDVAASAAGIAEQMKLIGEQAAGGLSQGINAQMPTVGREAGRAVGETLGAEVVTALTRSLGDMGRLIEQTVAAAGSTGSAAAAAAAGVKIGESLGAGAVAGFEKATTQLAATTGAAGTKIGQAMGAGVASGLTEASPEVQAAMEAVTAKMAATARTNAIAAANATTEAYQKAADEQAAIADKKAAYDQAAAQRSSAATVAEAARANAALAAEADKAAQTKAAAANKAADQAKTAADKAAAAEATAAETAAAKAATAAEKRTAAETAVAEQRAAAGENADSRTVASAETAYARAAKAAETAEGRKTSAAEKSAAAQAELAQRTATATAAAAEASATAATAAAAKSWAETASAAEKGASDIAASAKKASDAQIAAAESANATAIDLANKAADAVQLANQRQAAFTAQTAKKAADDAAAEAERTTAKAADEAKKAADAQIAEAERSAAGNLAALERVAPQLNQAWSKIGQGASASAGTGMKSFGDAIIQAGQELHPRMDGMVQELNELLSHAMSPPEFRPADFDAKVAEFVPRAKLAVSEAGKKIAAGFGDEVGGGMGDVGQKILGYIAPSLATIMPSFENVGKSAASIFRKAYGEEAAKMIGDQAPLAEDVMNNFAGKMGVAGKAAGQLMGFGIAGAVIAAADLVVHAVADMVQKINETIGEIGKYGFEAANTMMEGISSVIEGKAPDFKQAFSVLTDGIGGLLEAPMNMWKGSLDGMFGHIPVIGEEVKAMTGEVSAAFSAVGAVFGEATTLAEGYIQTMTEVGDAWTEVARTIAGQTLNTENLQEYVQVVQNITASGAVVHFKEVGEVVGELNSRLQDLDNGAGLTKDQLQELATTLAEGNEVLGNIHINVDNLTAAFNDFGIKAEDTNQELTTLVNISRETGAGLNEMLTDIDQVGPAMQELGYNLDQTTMLMAEMNQQLGDPAMNRMAFGIAQIQEQFEKQGITDAKKGMSDLVNVVRDFTKAGEDGAAVDYLKQFVGSARTAETIVAGIKDGAFKTPEELQAVLNSQAEALHQPLDEILEQTKSLGDTFEQLSNQAMGSLAPIAIPLMNALREAGNSVSDWIRTHKVEIVEWAGEIGQDILTAVGFMSKGIANVLVDVAGAANLMKNLVVTAMLDVGAAIEPVLYAAGLFSDTAKHADEDLRSLMPTLKGIRDTDISAPIDAFASKLHNFGQGEIPKLQDGLQGVIDKATGTAAIGQAFVQTFTDAEGAVHHLDDAFEKTKDKGFQILGGPDTIAAVKKQLGDLGITVQTGADGVVTGITARTQAEADAFKSWWQETFGKEDALPGASYGVGHGPESETQVKVVPDTNPNAIPDGLGLPSEMWHGDHLEVPTQLVPESPGAPGTSGAPVPMGPQVWKPPADQPPPPTNWDPENLFGASTKKEQADQDRQDAQDKLAGGGLSGLLSTLFSSYVTTPKSVPEITAAAGVPSSLSGPRGLVIPTAFSVQKNEDLQSSELLSNTGVTTAYQGNIPNAAADGIVIPTGFTIKTAESLDPSALMSNAGVDADHQGEVGTDGSMGVVLPTGLNMKDGDQKSVNELMQSVGIPSENQGDTGVTLDVSFNMPQNGAGGGGGAFPVQDASFPGGGGDSGSAQPPAPGGPVAPFSGGSLQAWLGPQLQAQGLSPDEARGIMAMNQVEGGANSAESLLGFTESQAKGPEGHLQAFMKQWNDMSRRPNGQLPGVGPGGNVTDWDAYMTWIREKIVGQNGSPSDWQGNAQPAPQDYQNRLMQALKQIPAGPSGFAFSGGGDVPDTVSGPWTPGKDTVPMDLPAGSFVVNRAASQQHRALLDRVLKGNRSSGASGKLVPSILEPGERLIPPAIAKDNLPLLHAVNGGTLAALAGGGQPDAVPGAGPAGGDIQGWLAQQLTANGLTADQARGILAMNVVEGGNTDPRSLLGFVESQARGPQAHVAAFMQQWNDMSRRPGGQIPGMSPDGSVSDWTKYMTWIREKIVGQTGNPSDFQGNKQPAWQDYQARLMNALGPITSTVATVSPTQHFASGGSAFYSKSSFRAPTAGSTSMNLDKHFSKFAGGGQAGASDTGSGSTSGSWLDWIANPQDQLLKMLLGDKDGHVHGHSAGAYVKGCALCNGGRIGYDIGGSVGAFHMPDPTMLAAFGSQLTLMFGLHARNLYNGMTGVYGEREDKHFGGRIGFDTGGFADPEHDPTYTADHGFPTMNLPGAMGLDPLTGAMRLPGMTSGGGRPASSPSGSHDPGVSSALSFGNDAAARAFAEQHWPGYEVNGKVPGESGHPLTEEMYNSLSEYSRDPFLSGLLRDVAAGGPDAMKMKPEYLEQIQDLDQAIAAGKTPQDLNVSRSVHWNALGGKPDDLNSMIGRSITDPGFMSTYLQSAASKSGDLQNTASTNPLLNLMVPAGTPGYYLSQSGGNALSRYGTQENELLLGRNNTIIPQAVTPGGNGLSDIIHALLVPGGPMPPLPAIDPAYANDPQYMKDYRDFGGRFAMGGRVGFDSGGHVEGPWSPGKDSIPMDLPSGTFVVNRDRSFAHRGLLDNLMKGSTGSGGKSRSLIPSILEVGERLVPPDIAEKNLPLLHAVNSGRVGMQGGGALQVIYDDTDTGQEIGEAGGNLVGPGTSQPGYYRNDWKDHKGHVHTSFATGPNGEFYGLPKGSNITQGGAGFPAWVYELGNQYGVVPSTYPGHQEGSGYNRGIDWWPKDARPDMQGAGYSTTDRNTLKTFAESIALYSSGDGPGAASAGGGGGGVNRTASYGMGGGGGGGAGMDSMFESTGFENVSSGSSSGSRSGGGSKGDPGNPRVTAPYAPGTSYADVAPPPDMPRVPQGTPGSVDTPFGTFQFPRDMPDGGMSIPPEQRGKLDAWLIQQQTLQQQGVRDTQAVNDAQAAVDDPSLQANATRDQTVLDNMNAANAKLTPEDRAKVEASKTYTDAVKAAAASTKAVTDAQNRLNDALMTQKDNQIRSQDEADKPPPWEKNGGSSNSDMNSIGGDLGKGIITGMFQELGFPDVFGKPFTQWGITKLLSGIGGFGLNLLSAESGGQGQPLGGALGGLTKALGIPDGTFGGTGGSGSPGGGGAWPLPLDGIPHAPTDPTPGPNGPATDPNAANNPGGGGPAAPATPAPAAGTPAPTPGAGTPGWFTPSTPGAPPVPANAPAPPGQGAPGTHPGYEFGSPDRPPPGGYKQMYPGVPTPGGGPGGSGTVIPGINAPLPGAGPTVPAPAPGGSIQLPGLPAPTGGSIQLPTNGSPVPPGAGPGLLPFLPPLSTPGAYPKPSGYTMPGSQAPVGGGGGGDIISAGFNLLTDLLPSAATRGSSPAPVWDIAGSPPPPANTPAAMGSSTPAIVQAPVVGSGTTVSNPLTVNNTYQGFNPTPAVKDQVSQIAATTSAPAMAGGGGIPL